MRVYSDLVMLLCDVVLWLLASRDLMNIQLVVLILFRFEQQW
jgi:hypothetical protein